MTTVAGQMINFHFSTQYDKPKDIFQNMVSKNHVLQCMCVDFVDVQYVCIRLCMYVCGYTFV